MAKKVTRKRARTRATTKKRTAARKSAAKRPARKSKPARARRATAKAAARKPARRPAARKTAKSAPRAKSAARAAATRRRRERPAVTRPSALASAAAAVRGTIAGAVATVAGKLRRDAPADAIQLLEREHRRFEALLKQGEDTTERARTGRRELLDTLASALSAHELMEEKVLYPALQAHPEARDIVLEGFEEHHVADVIVKELYDVATDDEAWGAKFTVLKENIEHHIQEEEGQMFRVARGVFSQEELRDLAARMLAVRP